jgi:ATP-dependent helicase/nuclease subunit A
MRTRTNVRALEDALEDYGIPYRVEGGSLVLDTPEVRDLLSCLRAVDDPSDQVALVAALRSPAYACSDEDLLAWVDGGGRLSYEPSDTEGSGPVAVALDSLRAFHQARFNRSVAATIESFIQDRMLAIGAFGQRRPREALRRLRYVVARAREMASVGRPTLRAFLDWLDDLQRAEFRDLESPIPDADDDAVRLMTMHGAKGLEFPIVFLTGLGAEARSGGRGVQVIADREDGCLEVGYGSFQTPGFGAALDREKRHGEAESVRLLYVAATRARDHLILGVDHAKATTPAARILELLENADPSLCEALSVDHVEKPAQIHSRVRERDAIDPLAHQTDEEMWIESRRLMVRSLANDAVTTPTDLVRLANGIGAADGATRRPRSGRFDQSDELLFDDEVAGIEPDDPDAEPEPAVPDRARRIGRAVHAALVATSGEPGGAHRAAVTMSRAYGVPDDSAEVELLVRAVLSCSAYRYAIASPRHWHEVPVGVDADGVLLEGRIDLVWERPDGTLGIIDVKTDRIAPEEALSRSHKYRPQIGAYALALEQATHQRVSCVQVVFAALGGLAIELEDVVGLMDETRGLIEKSFG